MRVRVLLEPQHGGTYDQLLRLARATEEAGFDAFFRSDHYLGVDEHDASYLPTDSWATLAGLARETSTVRLGTMVTAGTFRLPGVLAVTAATVDVMSGGRVELGLGAGWYDREHSAFGIHFPAVGERFDRLEEQFAVVAGLWADPAAGPFSFAGRHYRIDACQNRPRTAQPGGPPLIVGGAGPKRTPALAAKYAAEYNGTFPDGVGERFAVFRQACERIGRDPESARLSVILPVACGSARAEVERRTASIGTAPLLEQSVRGSADEVVERARKLEAEGADTIYFHLYDVDDVDHVHLLGEHVVPHLR